MAEIENAKKKLFISNHRTFVFIVSNLLSGIYLYCITCSMTADPAMAMDAPVILVHGQ